MNFKKISVLLLSIVLVSVNLFGCGEKNISDNPDTKKEIASEENESEEKTTESPEEKDTANSEDENVKNTDEKNDRGTKVEKNEETCLQVPMYIWNSKGELIDVFGEFNLLEVYKDEAALKLVDKHNSFDYVIYDYSTSDTDDIEVEYRVIKYSITLSEDIDVDPTGTPADIGLYVKGLDKGSLIYNNSYYVGLTPYILRPYDPNTQYIFKGETVECYLLYVLPKGCREYLLELGNGNNERAYLNSKYIE